MQAFVFAEQPSVILKVQRPAYICRNKLPLIIKVQRTVI